MHLANIPFSVTDWSQLERVEHAGDTGMAWWRTLRLGDIRVRLVEYSPGYRANHWCEKGHILFCLEGELETALEDGRTFTLRAGYSYQVADGVSRHRSASTSGVRLFLVA